MPNNDNKKAFDASQRPPPLPNRPAAPALGSASTGHYTIHASEKSPFREPELVPDDTNQPALGTDQGGRPFDYNSQPPGDGWGNIQEGTWASQSGQYYGNTSSDAFAQPEKWVAGAPAPTWGTFEDGWNTGSARRSVLIPSGKSIITDRFISFFLVSV
ncbi:hypothetical protein EI94DRAFT_1834392 [Lactarius quietus]|nr:hypothetical protein EI94DRAFT_1834392 [Lactarius quietus]